jgi:hypothetical protein
MVPGGSETKRTIESKNILWTEGNRTMEDRTPREVFADDMSITFKYLETVMRQSCSQPEKS